MQELASRMFSYTSSRGGVSAGNFSGRVDCRVNGCLLPGRSSRQRQVNFQMIVSNCVLTQ